MSLELIGLIALVTTLCVSVAYYLFRQFQRAPEVVVYAVPDLQKPAVINLVLKNGGTASAQDVSFASNKKIPARAFGFDDAPQPGYMADGPLIEGIASLKPGEKRVITWGQYGGLKKGLGDDFLEITASYSSKPAFGVKQDQHRTTSKIDLGIVKGPEKVYKRPPVSDEQLEEPSLRLASLK